MNDLDAAAPISPLRQRLIDDMTMRRFSHETQRNYLRDIARLATFLGRSPGTATAEDLRRFQVEQREAGVPVPTMNSIVAALRFLFTHTLDRPDLSRKLVRLARKLPAVLSRDEVARLLDATPCLKHPLGQPAQRPRRSTSFRATSTTRAPASAARLTVVSPMPLVAPVTTMTWDERLLRHCIYFQSKSEQFSSRPTFTNAASDR